MNLKALYNISYGVYIITSKVNERLNGQIANTVFQVTSEPPIIAVSINKQNLTHRFIQESKKFTVSILSKETPLKFIGLFGFQSGRNVNKFADINYKISKIGVPIVIDNSLGYLETEVINTFDAGTHTVFIGRVVNAELLKDDEPLTYAYYHEIKRGTAPKTAPTYIKEEKREVKKMGKYRCTVCNYVYDPEKGDPDSGIKAGTPFEKLPDDWVCPVCGASKDMFEKEV